MRLLDLFCGAGGAAVGYHRAGFDEIVGVDNRPMPRYPFTFVQADALMYVSSHGHEFDAIHASPPCHKYSEATPAFAKSSKPDLIGATQKALRASGKPYAIENVENARRLLRNPVMLCGTMFGMTIWRHRYFELWPAWGMSPSSCKHIGRPITIHPGSNARKGRISGTTDDERTAMGIDWMTGAELDEAIPPTYTEYIGRHLLTVLAPVSA